ncbi:2-oxoacid:ferredoxin oxidoreductase subunit beta, partial [Dietzia aurantiaca]
MTTIERPTSSLVGAALPLDALAHVPKTDAPQKPKDYTSDQEVRWCPG